MRIGGVVSVLLHAGVLGLIVFGTLPEFLRTKIVEAPVIPIDMIDEAELAKVTSVPAAAPKPKPEAMKPPDLPKPKVDPVPAPKIEEPEPEPAPAPKPEPKKPAPVKPKPKPKPEKPEDLDLDALSALVDKSKKAEAASEADADAPLEADTARPAIGPGDRLTATEIDKMRAAVSRCWNASAIIGAPEPEKLVVVIDIDLNRDGSLKGAPRVVNALEISLSGNRFWQVAQQNAVRAVQLCAPYDFFDPARYREWQAFTLNFDPSQMVGF